MLAEKNTYIDSAYQRLQVISQDKEKRMEYEAREKAFRDYNQGMYEAEQRGIQIGEQRGEQRGTDRINRLNSLLIQDQRLADLERSVRDADFQKQLLEEYGF